VSVIHLPQRKLLGKIATPRPLAGIAISADGGTVIAVDDEQPTLFLIDTKAGKMREEVPLKDVPKPAQIARYAPDFSLLTVTSVRSDTVSLIDPSFVRQTAIKVGSQPMDMGVPWPRIVRCVPGRRLGARHRHSRQAAQDKLLRWHRLRVAWVFLVLRCLEWVEMTSRWQPQIELPGDQIDDGLEVAA
jgi:hypothetical protein